MKKAYLAVLHVTPVQFGKLMTLGMRVINNMGSNTVTFSNPDPVLSVLRSAADELEILMGAAKTGNHQKVQARNEQALEYYKMLQTERDYVNGVAQGDRAIILLSGFDASNDPSSLPVPGAPAIRRIDDGLLPLSANILLVNQSGPSYCEKEEYVVYRANVNNTT